MPSDRPVGEVPEHELLPSLRSKGLVPVSAMRPSGLIANDCRRPARCGQLDGSRSTRSDPSKLEDAVVARGEDAASIGTEARRADGLLVKSGRAKALAAPNVPEPRDLVGTARQKSLVIGAESRPPALSWYEAEHGELRLAASQIRAEPSLLPVANQRPSGLKDAAETGACRCARTPAWHRSRVPELDRPRRRG